MSLTLVHLRTFTSEFRALGLTDHDLRALENQLVDAPTSGKPIPGTGGLRKVRFSPPSWNRGKSGSTRVCYVYFQTASAIYLFTIYTKTQQENLSPADKARYRTVLTAFARHLKDHPEILP